MRILVTNDDGYATNGIKAIAGLLSKFGKVTIVAPRMAQSGKSASLSLEDPLRMEYAGRADGIETYFCNGTPADCVKLAMNTVFLDQKPDLLISGINHGSNASVASIYSGTLGAAMEGTLYDVPSLGFSICSHDHEADLSGVLEYGEKIIRKVIESPMKKDVFMNINFPDCPAGKIRGIRFGHQGKGQWINEFDKRTDPFGKDYYWMCGKFQSLESENEYKDDGTEYGDHVLMKENFIAIVLVKIDRTDYEETERLRREWSSILG